MGSEFTLAAFFFYENRGFTQGNLTNPGCTIRPAVSVESLTTAPDQMSGPDKNWQSESPQFGNDATQSASSGQAKGRHY